jgi:hypothetical protein
MCRLATMARNLRYSGQRPPAGTARPPWLFAVAVGCLVWTVVDVRAAIAGTALLLGWTLPCSTEPEFRSS